MKKYLKYLPYLLCLILFLVGRMTAPAPDKELRKKFEAERKQILEVIGQRDAEIVSLTQKGQEIRKQMTLDSLKFSIELQANKRAYTALKKKYNEINLNRANAHTLDSIISRLYPD